jgi:hypothetical protein
MKLKQFILFFTILGCTYEPYNPLADIDANEGTGFNYTKEGILVPPENVSTAIDPGGTTITLSWSQMDSIDCYFIYRKVTSLFYDEAFNDSSNFLLISSNASYIDSDVYPLFTYTYYISSSLSNFLSVQSPGTGSSFTPIYFDEVEPNDDSATAMDLNSNYSVLSNNVVRGTLDASNDEDILKITLAGGTYNLFLNKPGNNNYYDYTFRCYIYANSYPSSYINSMYTGDHVTLNLTSGTYYFRIVNNDDELHSYHFYILKQR